jgi:hypothetical protein
MMDETELEQSLKDMLRKTWEHGGKIVIPIKSLVNAEIKDLEFYPHQDYSVLRLEIPLGVDEDGFRIAFEIEEKE